ncbi:hypothetical protein ADUPG1_000323 [Aduncisulcus paluster]|uniref:Uncharacterized protein n=1 Tax=Aduncisulcus paluster TaxID=2918883 RepID=A0ABQ5K6C8_9EUKA|nr:hypothetical protein ADUPG1_000323 [Aduncisulcus paluster]
MKSLKLVLKDEPFKIGLPRRILPPVFTKGTSGDTPSFVPSSGIRGMRPSLLNHMQRATMELSPEGRPRIVGGAKRLDRKMEADYNMLASTCRRSRRVKAEAVVLYNLGTLYDNCALYEKSVRIYEKYLECANRIDDLRALVVAVNALGCAEHLAGHPDRAIHYHKQHIELCLEIQEKFREQDALPQCPITSADLATGYNNIGLSLTECSEYSDASQAFSEALTHAIAISDKGSAERVICVNLAQVCNYLGDFETARSALQRHAELSDASKDIKNLVLDATVLHKYDSRTESKSSLSASTSKDILMEEGDLSVSIGIGSSGMYGKFEKSSSYSPGAFLALSKDKDRLLGSPETPSRSVAFKVQQGLPMTSPGSKTYSSGLKEAIEAANSTLVSPAKSPLKRGTQSSLGKIPSRPSIYDTTSFATASSIATTSFAPSSRLGSKSSLSSKTLPSRRSKSGLDSTTDLRRTKSSLGGGGPSIKEARFVLNQLGQVARSSGDHSEATRLFSQARSIASSVGDDKGVTLGQVARSSGDHSEATRLFSQARSIASSVGDDKGVTVDACQLAVSRADSVLGGYMDKIVKMMNDASTSSLKK